MANLVLNSTNEILYCRATSGEIISSDELRHNPPTPNYQDVDHHLENGLFALRRPGKYRTISNICALPPQTSWWISDDFYWFAEDLRPSCARPCSIEAIFEYAQRLLQKMSPSRQMAVELSGGLDSSLIIEFMLRQEFPLSLVAFVSSRYEFRTERAVQAHYEEQCSSVCLIPYEECPAFGFLDKVPSHPFPAQESLFYARHLAAAKACVTLEVDLLLSGEAGDQLLGFAPDPCDFRGRAPKGYAYWNLAELWSDQYVYRPLGCSYVSGLALGRLPAMLLQARAGLGSDHMKIWARNKLRNHLPTMLTDYAYKAFHDGWVIDGLLAARSTIHKIADYSYNLIGHPALSPSLMLENSENYRHLSEEQRRQFLAMLSFATWAYSNRSEAL